MTNDGKLRGVDKCYLFGEIFPKKTNKKESNSLSFAKPWKRFEGPENLKAGLKNLSLGPLKTGRCMRI